MFMAKFKPTRDFVFTEVDAIDVLTSKPFFNDECTIKGRVVGLYEPEPPSFDEDDVKLEEGQLIVTTLDRIICEIDYNEDKKTAIYALLKNNIIGVSQ